MNLKILGSIAIVAGTSIGAGMLALPLATAALGIIPALLLLVIIWGLSGYTALLMLEINLKSGVGDNVHIITGKLLGKKGQFIQGLSFLSLLFALTAAYLTGGSSLLVLKAQNLFNLELNNQLAVIIFTLVLGGFSALGVAWVDKISRFLFALMLIFFASLLIFLLPDISMSNMIASEVSEQTTNGWLVAIPIIFTSFGFHVCIATLVRYLDGDTQSLRKVLIIGSSIPLVCYVLWLLLTLGTVGGDTISTFAGSLPKLVTSLQDIAAEPLISKFISLFADFALITSFLGVTMSLYDFLAELTRSSNTWLGRLQTWLITFVPPLLCALYVPEGFVAVLGFAAIPLVIMMIFLPVSMAIKQRRIMPDGYRVSGGTVALSLAAMCGIIIVGSQLYVAL